MDAIHESEPEVHCYCPALYQPNIFTLYRDAYNFILNEASKFVKYFRWVIEKAKRKKKIGERGQRKRVFKFHSSFKRESFRSMEGESRVLSITALTDLPESITKIWLGFCSQSRGNKI